MMAMKMEWTMTIERKMLVIHILTILARFVFLYEIGSSHNLSATLWGSSSHYQMSLEFYWLLSIVFPLHLHDNFDVIRK